MLVQLVAYENSPYSKVPLLYKPFLAADNRSPCCYCSKHKYLYNELLFSEVWFLLVNILIVCARESFTFGGICRLHIVVQFPCTLMDSLFIMLSIKVWYANLTVISSWASFPNKSIKIMGVRQRQPLYVMRIMRVKNLFYKIVTLVITFYINKTFNC